MKSSIVITAIRVMNGTNKSVQLLTVSSVVIVLIAHHWSYLRMLKKMIKIKIRSMFENLLYQIQAAYDRWVSDPLTSCRSFAKNAWLFRKQLAEFRGWDYGYNLAMLERSLEITRDMLRSEQAVSAAADKHANEIDQFLFHLTMARDASQETEVAIDYSLSAETAGMDVVELVEYFSDPANTDKLDQFQKHRNITEEEHWNLAWALFQDKCQEWWD
jgi:hypothetical protein